MSTLAIWLIGALGSWFIVTASLLAFVMLKGVRRVRRAVRHATEQQHFREWQREMDKHG
jgi:hypothetical protein